MADHMSLNLQNILAIYIHEITRERKSFQVESYL